MISKNMYAFYISSVLATAFLAAIHTFSNCKILDRAWARLAVVLGLIGAFMLASRRATFVPAEGQTFVPPSVLRRTIPEGAVTALELTDIPAEATRVVYWAAPPELNKKLDNSGLVDVVGGRATLRMHCPRSVDGKPRSVSYRFAHDDGKLSSVKQAFVKC